jgi:predicted CopG family antitoxin
VIDGTMFTALFFIIMYLLYLNDRMRKEHEKHVDVIHEMVGEERQKLIDRIQAPSFDHLKHAEIRKIKAEKEEPVERVELL